MKWLSCCLLACTACSEVVPLAEPDAMSEDVPDAEVAPDSVMEPCDLSQPFGSFAPLSSLDSAKDDLFATLSPDERTIYFSSNRDGATNAQVDLFVATRASREVPFGAPVSMTTVNSAGDDRSPSISDDGLELFFHSSRDGNYELYVATRNSTAVPFGDPVKLGADINTADIETSPVLAAGGTALYFDRTDASDVTQLYRATRGPTGFASPTLVAGLGTSPSRSAPSADELTLYFSSDRTGGVGLVDAWVATRASTAAAWGDVTNLAEINSATQEMVDWASPDGCRIYYSSMASGKFHLWTASRPDGVR